VKYRVEIDPHARRTFRRLPPQTQDRILRGLNELKEDPRPHGVVKLTDRRGAYRIRVGDYRVVYEIHDRVLLVLVIEIDHRRDVYR